ncbi:TadE/TadG family type IV pilus assembly protein [Aestuariicoccus sp. MJ-SS9]|uniref:TadE/TadG family type IV pilus assembly protein n=1 Tax=Aestuariicoccus sp. MJ-SS9 TaxID=3079855 RepID=UPI00290D6487|nr:TadE/TadG family type IV pilus assembly protein [Aestuariicoccus sp. MJ-SS9]MDU8913275.1 TadE/TadG family type IV pilus assembly protein [Aestuariicoccus sp. MJ-SS9]
MVGKERIRSFIRSEDGISMTEALIIMPIVLLVITAMIEFGILVLQWNQSVKALQVGARLLAVSTPLVDDYEDLGDFGGTIGEGEPVPSGVASTGCGAGAPVACPSARLNRLMTGGDGTCEPTTPAIDRLVGVCDVAPWIRPENLQVTYSRAGLGYVGRPAGPVTTITLELKNQTFEFVLLGALLEYFTGGTFSNVPMPPNAVTITSEDLSDCRTAC